MSQLPFTDFQFWRQATGNKKEERGKSVCIQTKAEGDAPTVSCGDQKESVYTRAIAKCTKLLKMSLVAYVKKPFVAVCGLFQDQDVSCLDTQVSVGFMITINT